MFAFFGGGGGGTMRNPMSHANSLILGGVGGNPVELQSAAGQLLMSDPVSGAVTFTTGGKKRFFHNVLAVDTISFSIASIPAGWGRLIIEVVGRIDIGTGNPVQLRFNGDSGNNYSTVWTENGAAASLTGTSYIRMGTLPAASDMASVAAVARASIPLYDGTTFQKTGLAEWGRFVSAATYLIGSGTYYWLNTAAIASATVLAGGNKFLAGTVCNAYVEM